jgi:hypothetical protein
MKKFFLLTLLGLLISSVTFAQKNYKKQAQALVKKYKPVLKTPTGERSAAYLVDSTKLKFHDSGDSTLLAGLKYKYNANGTVKSDETFIDFFGLVESYEKSNYFYNAAKPLQLKYKSLYGSTDKGVSYDEIGVDSFFYDTKDRLILDRTRDIVDNSVSAYTIYKYKTAFETPDTVRSYLLNAAGDNLVPQVFTYNTLDAKGNTIVIIESNIVDFQTEEFDLSTKSEYKFDSQNQVTEEVSSDWDIDNKAWLISGKTLFYYNANGTPKYALGLGTYDETLNTFGSKDSTHYVLTVQGAIKETNVYTYDFDKKIYSLSSRDLNKYDAKGNNVRNESYTGTLADPTVLELQVSTDSWFSFYKDAIATKDLFSTDFEIIVANPVADNQALTLNTKREGEYALLTYDLNGKMINRQMIKNNQTVITQLPTAGTYIFFVTDSQNVPLAMKKVVKM